MRGKKITTLLYSIFVSVYCLFKTRKKFAYSFFAVLLATVVTLSSVLVVRSIKSNDKKITPNKEKEVSQKEVTVEEKSVQPELVEEKVAESAAKPILEEEPVPEKPTEPKEEVPTEQPPVESQTTEPVADLRNSIINVVPGGKSNRDPDDNDFLDALIYTGYNIQKHRSDGLMWTYILASQKKGKGWLSNISYNFGCTGYETNADGEPDIARFERGGLVCASYATYVYFNYLPHIAGIDVSVLAKPADPQKAQQWYLAGKKWIEDGFSKYIEWNAHMLAGTNHTVFEPAEPIPIGSLMFTQDFNNRNGYATHISLYAGYKNGYHWVTHVGNLNGPEFCAMERMSCGPDPQWPLAIITTPNGLIK